MDSAGAIPDIVIRRLPIYARSLAQLGREGITTVSSSELGVRIGVTAAQIRRDLSYFGEFGKQGKGYDVQYLLDQIKEILSLNREWKVALVGLGNLGQAIIHHNGFRDRGFKIAALFDRDPEKIGQEVNSLRVRGMEGLREVLHEEGIEVTIIAVPASSAQDVVNQLVEAGAKAILNYSPTVVQVPSHIWVRHIDPIVALQSMTYYLATPRPRARVARDAHQKQTAAAS
ncbi:MAG: redox-sensing transcriptional repressor Rex [Chloroflexi bacterium]|nr:redox-sensing transcriptional repressor Rex [Chloroflexota bacterium]